MKLNFNIVIEAPQEVVWAAFDDPANLPRWQRNLKSANCLEGERGHPGAVTELIYETDGKASTLRETVTERAAPSFMASVYSGPDSKTLVVDHFERVDSRATRWSCWLNLQYRGWKRVKAIFSAGDLLEQREADMAQFKLMVETDVQNRSPAGSPNQ